ncbi:putative actin cytoskeleton organization protein [Erysiphe necator]|uniref:Putative actin cytoskeleton organization protein n=1 Tax=Uncinula necator TaxID=52586 RepID=A0A0B1PA50_UNCNE|nr:putative actin cytoskeleton organization protein [Erysiphe necator]
MSVVELGTDLSNEKSIEDWLASLNDQLQEKGLKDEEKCQLMISLTKILNDDNRQVNKPQSNSKLYHQLIDDQCLETIIENLDLRQSQLTRSHVILAISAYLNAADNSGSEKISRLLLSKIKKGTSEDFKVAFSAVASLFPVIPDHVSTIVLNEGFLSSLELLIKRKEKDGAIEQAVLEMLNVACMNTNCRDAIRKICIEWLTEKVQSNSGPSSINKYSESIKDLAAIILAKLQAVPPLPTLGTEERIQPASITTEELSLRFKNTFLQGSSEQSSIEGLAYTSLNSKIKETLAYDQIFLLAIIKALGEAPAKSSTIFGALTILVNITAYKPVLLEEQKRINQLKAYATATNLSKTPDNLDQLDDDEHVSKRCQAVFEAGIIPILVTHIQNSSTSSLTLAVSVTSSLARTPKIRGKMAQQGAVKMLIHAFSKFPTENQSGRRTAALALARILITTNPNHVFGGSNPISITSAVTPLVLILSDDPTVEHRDLLPVFESLLALTNIASTDDTARNSIIRLTFSQLEELLLSNNVMVTRAAVELVCNLVQSPEGVAKFADGSKQASNRMHILLALSDAEDSATCKAAGGALASLTQWDTAVNSILERDRGARLLLRLCKEDEEDLRHRGVVCILNVLSIPNEIGKWGYEKIKNEKGFEILKECLKKSKNQEVLDIAVEALKLMRANEKHESNS